MTTGNDANSPARKPRSFKVDEPETQAAPGPQDQQSTSGRKAAQARGLPRHGFDDHGGRRPVPVAAGRA
jgi:hypothetical protein